MLEAVQRDHRVGERCHQRVGGFDLIRSLPLRRAGAGKEGLVLSDLGGQALLRFEVPLRLLLGRLGAALDLGQLTAAAGDDFFRERLGLFAGGLFGLHAGLPDGVVKRRACRFSLGFGDLGVAPSLFGLEPVPPPGSIGCTACFRVGPLTRQTEMIAGFLLAAGGVVDAAQKLRALYLEARRRLAGRPWPPA